MMTSGITPIIPLFFNGIMGVSKLDIMSLF